jgi:hypothetical protein
VDAAPSDIIKTVSKHPGSPCSSLGCFFVSALRLLLQLEAASFHSVGEWLSLVEHLVRDQGVGGSNPLSPTILFKGSSFTDFTDSPLPMAVLFLSGFAISYMPAAPTI